jgi:hypothetical protein
MSDSRKQSLAILMRIADFIENLPEEHVTDLEAGAALLTIIPAGSTEPVSRAPARARAAARAPKVSAVDVRQVADAVRTSQTREAATAALRPLRKDPELKEVAALLSVVGLGNLPKDRLIDAIVEATVGSRLDFQAIQGSATLPYEAADGDS